MQKIISISMDIKIIFVSRIPYFPLVSFFKLFVSFRCELGYVPSIFLYKDTNTTNISRFCLLDSLFPSVFFPIIELFILVMSYANLDCPSLSFDLKKRFNKAGYVGTRMETIFRQ